MGQSEVTRISPSINSWPVWCWEDDLSRHDRNAPRPKPLENHGPTTPDKLYADAGCDAEWIHQLCPNHQIQTVIKPARSAADDSRRGYYRSQMSEQYLKLNEYGKRWLVETYNSGLKRTTGSTLNARNIFNLFTEAAIRVLTYALRR